MDKQKLFFEQLILTVLTPVNFLLSLLIVFHHAFTVEVDYRGSFAFGAYSIDVAFQRFMYNLSECAVPVFFFISAFLFYRTFDGTWGKYKEKMRRRVRSLFIPYILFCTLGYIKALMFNGGIENGNFYDYIVSIWESNTMPLWFIRELMALSILAPFCWRLIKCPWLAFILCSLIFVLIAFGIVPYRSFVYWIPVYLLGASCNRPIWNKVIFLMQNHIVKVISIIIIVAYVISAWYLPNGISKEQMTWLQNGIFAIFRYFTPVVFICVMWWMIVGRVKGRSFMQYSFFVYCLHAPVIALVRLIYEKLHLNSMLPETMKYLIIVFFVYFICVLVAMILQKHSPSVWKILNGGR